MKDKFKELAKSVESAAKTAVKTANKTAKKTVSQNVNTQKRVQNKVKDVSRTLSRGADLINRSTSNAMSLGSTNYLTKLKSSNNNINDFLQNHDKYYGDYERNREAYIKENASNMLDVHKLITQPSQWREDIKKTNRNLENPYQKAMAEVDDALNTLGANKSEHIKKYGIENYMKNVIHYGRVRREIDKLGRISAIKPETLGEDLSKIDNMIRSTNTNWKSEKDLDYSLDELKKVYDRVNGLENYYKKYEPEKDVKDLEEIKNWLGHTIDNWGEYQNYYGKYSSEEEYNNEKLKLETLYNASSENIKPYLKDKDNPVAYTTKDGYGITWKELYNTAREREIGSQVTAEDIEKFGGFNKKDVEYYESNGFDKNGIPTTYYTTENKNEHIYNLVNGDEDAVKKETLMNVNMYDTNDKIRYTYVNEDEVKRFNALWEKEGEKVAMEYLDSISPELRKRRNEDEITRMTKYADEHPVSATIGSFFMGFSPVRMSAGIITAGDYLSGREIDTDDPIYNAGKISSAMKGKVEEGIDNGLGKFFYRHGMNAAENIATNFLSMGNPWLNLMLRLPKAFEDTVVDAKARGLSDDQAVAIAGVATVAEAFFESKSFEAFFDTKGITKTGWNKFVNYIATEVGGELLTEGTTDIADYLIAQDLSNINLSFNQYIKDGYTEKEAGWKVVDDYLKKYADIAAGTAFSAGVTAGPNSVMSSITRSNYMTEVGETLKQTPKAMQSLLQLGIKNDNKLANNIAETIKEGFDVSAKEIGDMVDSVVGQSIEKDGGLMNIMKTITTLEGENSSFVSYQHAFDTAKAVMHFAQGKATDADNALLSRSHGAMTLLTAVEGNSKAIKSINTAAGTQLRESATEVRNAEYGVQSENITPTKAKVSEINKSLSDADIYSHGERISIPEDAKISDGIVISEASEKFRKSNHEGYNIIKKFAKSTKTPVIFVDELQGFDKDGNAQSLNGYEFKEGVIINLQSDDPVRFATTHEFGHRFKRLASESWQQYQDYVVKIMKSSDKYDAQYAIKRRDYDENQVDEEIAADYAGELFSDQKELARFIKTNRGLAVKVRDVWYSVLDYFGRLDEKKKAQQLWGKAYREAVQNRDVESAGESKKSATGTRENAQEEEHITVDMDEDKRAEILKKASLNIVEAKPDALKLTLEEIKILESKCKSKAQNVMEDLCEKFGVVKEGYTNKNIELEFNYSNSSLRGSMHKQNERNPDFKDFAKMLTVFDSVIENAVPIESHTDKYKGTKRENPNLKQSYVLLSAFKSGEDIVPVELNIKEFKIGTKNKLYMSVTLKKIRADILAALPNNSSENATPSALNISVAEIIKNVNPSDGDFLRYIPDEMLNEEQIKSKRESEERERLKIESLKNEYTREESSDKKSISGTRLSEYEGGELPFRPSSETGWLSQQWIAERSADNEAMAQPLAEISKIVTEELKVPVTRRKFTDEGVSGSYNLTSEAIHMRAANDIVTLSHEVGHHLDKVLKMQELKGFKTVVENFDRTLAALGYGEDAKKTEAVGEFIRMYLTNKDVAKTFAPEYYEAFENALKEKGLDKSIGRLANAVNAYLSSSISERLDLALSETDGRGKLQKLKEDGIRKELEEKKTMFSELWHGLNQNFIDSFYAIGKAQTRLQVENAEGKQDAHLLATNSLNSAARSAYILTKSFTNIDGDEIGMSFIDCITPIYNKEAKKKKENISNLNRYLVLKHALEWIEPNSKDVKRKRVFSDERLENPDVLRQEIAKIEAKLPEVKQAAENIYQYLRNLKKYWGVDMGIMTNDLSTKLDEMYPNYVPFFRENEKKGISGARVTLANQKAPILEASGGTELIVNPLESIVRLTEKYVKTASRNMAMQALANMADNIEGSGFIIERASEAKQNTLNGEDELSRNEKNRAKATPDELKKITTEEDVWTKEYRNGQGYVSVLIDGEKVWYQINDERLFKAVADMSPKQMSKLLQASNKVLQLKRALITSSNPLFAATNAVRDAITAYHNSDINNPVEYLGAYFTAFKHVLQRDPNYKRWCAMGGGNSSELSANMNSVRRALSKAMQTSTINKVMYSIRHPIEFVATINDAVESTPRLMAFEQEMKRSGDVHRAINKADDITTNFKRGGQTAKALNNVFMFSNAAIQGLDRTRRSFTQSDVKNGVRNRVIKYSLEAILLTAIQQFLNRRDDETEEDYKNLSKYMKRSQYVLSIGDGKFLRIPTAREQDLLRVVITDAIDMAFGDKESFEGLIGFTIDTLWPWYVEIPTNTKGKTMLELLTNMAINTARNTPIGTLTDFAANETFTGSPIVPEYYQDELPENQYDEKTSKLAVFLGKILKDSPMKIDYVINNNFGILGTLNKSLFPMDSTQVDKTFGFKARWIADSYYSTDVLNNVYDKRDAAETKMKREKTGANVSEYEKANALTTFISQYNKTISTLPDDEKRKARKQLLTIVNGWGNGDGASNDELIRLFDKTGENLFIKMPSSEVYTENGKRRMTSSEYVECVEKFTAGFETSIAEVISSKEYKEADDAKKAGMIEWSSKYALSTAQASTIPDASITKWEWRISEGRDNLSEVVSQKEDDKIVKDSKADWKKNNFDYDASKYSDDELSKIERVETDFAGYYTAKESGGDISRSDLRHVKVYDTQLKDNMSMEEYAEVRADAKTEGAKLDPDGSETNLSKSELKKYLDSTDYSPAVKAALFEAIGNKGWINPYTGKKIQ